MSRLPRLFISCLVALSSPVFAQEGVAVVEPLTVAVLPLAANAAGRDAAQGITSLISGRLSESPRLRVLSQRELQQRVGTERQLELVGRAPCEKGECVQELSSLTGARYVLTGRLDRFGGQYLLDASLVDTRDGRTLARPRTEASEDGELLRAVVAVTDELSIALESPGELVQARPLLGGAVASSPGGGLTLGLRFNNSFIDKVSSLNPGLDLEMGYWFHPEWQGFVQVGFTWVHASGDDEGELNVLPSIVGARHYHRLETDLRPYWGFGLGVQLSFGDYGIFQSTGPLPSVVGFVGLEYLLAGHVGFQLELGTNIAQAVLGLADDGAGDGLNFDVNAGIAYHF
uniref:CsgG/HfaB family protein n=1 Tax=Corallococcus coralloides TaxID=184914 RepID=UPI001F0C8FC8|nr:CsgG/HfaB family protein [Corallococcus coralloides]